MPGVEVRFSKNGYRFWSRSACGAGIGLVCWRPEGDFCGTLTNLNQFPICWTNAVVRGWRAELTNQKHLAPTAPIDVSSDNSGISRLQDRNLVLVVDDDPGILEGLQRLLQLHAYEPILFSSAEAFKNHTDFEQTVCVILDINLNDGSGIDLRHRLKAAGVSVPVIYMTGNEDPAVREAALASGCIAFLTKPFSAQELMEPLKRAGRHPNSGDAL
jgi:CheY-like chemotaxis protein